MLCRTLFALAFPASILLAQGRGIQPYGHAGTGFGFMKYQGGRTSSLEMGVIVRRHVAVGIERMRFDQGSEAGTWTVAQVRAYPFGIGTLAGVWLSAGIGWASARETETGSAQWEMLYRFAGAGSKGSVGADIRLAPHVFLSPALSVRRSIGSAESSMCSHAYDSSGHFAPTICGAWGPATYQFQAVDVGLAVSIR
jgi:hypothetical protein